MTLFKKFLLVSTFLATGLFATSVLASSLPVGTTQFSLAGAGVTSTSNTITLTSFKTPDGRAITMSNFGTVGYGALEPQTSVRLEDISFTGITQNLNGTATLTGISRGIDFVYPYAASTTLAYSHAGGSTFIITNTPSFYYNEFALFNDSNVTAWPTASTSVATKGYADFLAFNGAAVVPATTGTPGVSQLATQLQTASSTATNGSGYSLVIPSQNATSTYNSATAPLRVVVTQNSGTIDPNFIGGIATSTTLGAGGTLVQSIGKNLQVSTTIGTSTFSVPTGITSLRVTVQAPGAPGGSCVSTGGTVISTGGGGGGGWATKLINVTGTSTIQFFVGSTTTSTTTQAQSSNFGTNGFYLSATGGNPGASLTSGAGGNQQTLGGVGGIGGNTPDLSIQGQMGDSGFSGGNGSTVIISSGGVGGSSSLGFGALHSGAATGYGAGGQGMTCNNSSGNGSQGTNGAVIVQW